MPTTYMMKFLEIEDGLFELSVYLWESHIEALLWTQAPTLLYKIKPILAAKILMCHVIVYAKLMG